MMINKQFVSDLAIPPGEYLEEVLEEFGLKQSELARRMGRPAQMVNEIIKGDKAITPETSIQLEKVLGVPAYFWINLESEFRLIKAGQAEAAAALEEQKLLPKFPYSNLAKLGIVGKSNRPLERIQNLRRFFGVASLFNLDGVREYSPAFRQSKNVDVSHEALAAWLRTGTMIAKDIDCKKYSKATLIERLSDLRALTLETDANTFIPKLELILKECGVAFIFIPHFPKTHTTGATFWVEKEKAVLMMSLRGSWGDIFWFSLFHELGHILLHDKRSTFIENGLTDPAWKKQEDEADLFSQNTLIPKNGLKQFLDAYDFSRTGIESFAKRIGVSTGVVTGRLQHEKFLPYTANIGRIRYKWQSP